jgi:hypothetical protein
MPFLKENLQGHHYHWSNNADTNPAYTGQASRRFFDRDNGNQVLFLINLYESVSDKFTISEGHKIEKMINDQLPLEAKSEISVFNWLKSAS